jgi:cell division protein FtsB
MKAKARKSCSNCWRLQAKLNAQQAELEAQKRRLAALEATVAKLQEQLAAARKNSATSSRVRSQNAVMQQHS